MALLRLVDEQDLARVGAEVELVLQQLGELGELTDYLYSPLSPRTE